MPKRILLADDSITIQKVVELTFSDGDYEVTAVNNGAKAIQKLAEMRPDVILSDIIMPEKNGYEVCEYVKSHPEFRTIPVVLLTGTFEPFDPDRADKAGCDAVVTKPFESQSLIQKVEELVEQSRAAAPAAPQAEPAGSEQLSTGIFAPAMGEEHESDIFAAAPPEPAPAAPEIEASPWDEQPSTGGETRAFPSMSFEDLQRMASEAPAPPPPPAAPAPPEPSPWDEQPTTGSETRAFPAMSFDELQRMTSTPAPEPSPWDEQPATGGETRAFPAMSFDELQRMTSTPAPEPAPEPPAPAPEPSPWDEQADAGGETRAFPAMSFDDLQHMTSEPAQETPFEPTPEPPPPAPEAASPWDDQGIDFGSETRSFSRMSFEELEKMATSGSPMPPLTEQAEAAAAPAPAAEPEPVSQHELEPEPESVPAPLFAVEQEAPAEPELTAPPVSEPAPAVAAGDLSEDQIERIARRVVQLMSDQVVRNIAWEVIPDLAEMVVKERIRQLESEA